MNRIYQGRVSKIEILSEDRKNLTPIDTFEGRELDQSSPLWKHHETFQDAVNYYLLCLASLARSHGGNQGGRHGAGWLQADDHPVACGRVQPHPGHQAVCQRSLRQVFSGAA